MKKILIIASIAAAAVMVCGITGVINFSRKAETKQINFSVSKTASYESQAYSDAFATLSVCVYKVRGNERELLWKHNYNATQLKKFPAANKPMQQTVTIDDITDSRAKIEVCYSLIYNTKGSIMNFCNTEIVSNHSNYKSVNIHI